MTFQDNVKDYFKVGLKYIYYDNRIATCTGFRYDTGCKGSCCEKHHKFGLCDGSLQPTFDIFTNGHCACQSNGKDWFKLTKNSNTRW